MTFPRGHHFRSALPAMIPFVVSITAVLVVMYGITQTVYRQTANDPQVQRVHEVLEKIESGVSPTTIRSSFPIDLTTSLDTFIIITDESGKIQASDAFIAGRQPVPPVASLRYAAEHGQQRITWQPEDGVRLAIVTQTSKDKKTMVVVGRSLQEAEQRIRQLGMFAGAGWLVTLIGVYLSLVGVAMISIPATRSLPKRR